MEGKTGFLMLVLAVVCLAGAIMFAAPAGVEAQPQTANFEASGFNVNAAMADNLKALVGKRVTVTLDSGKTFTGIVKAVGERLLHLEKLEGKEFFDALINLESIRAVDTRVRS